MNFVALYLLPTTKKGKKKTNEQNKTKQKQKNTNK